MRLLKLGVYHARYLQRFYAARPTLKNQTYEIQHRALIEDCFGSSNFWTSALNKFGYETTDTIANAEFLQKAWANENNFEFDGNQWFFEITTEQIKRFRPDILLIADYSTFTPEFLRYIRRECSSIKLILGWCGAPYQNLDVMREWDVALSCVPEMVADFRANGLESFHINHAFSANILDKIELKNSPEIDFSFIGSVVKQSKFHIEREQLLLYLIENTNLQIWSEIAHPKSLRQRISNFLKRHPQLENQLANRTNQAVFGLEMFQKLRDSRVVFNNHIDISPISASNMRMFETTGVGACLLTDWKQNLAELFEPDVEVVTYKSAEECVEKYKYLINNESERQKIAKAGQLRTLKNHTFENRCEQIDEIIRSSSHF